VAGIVGSGGASSFVSRIGVAPASIIYSAKISCASGTSFRSDAIAAVDDALAWTPIQVVNNSNGSDTDEDDDIYATICR
jgi:hypothetical protein